MCKSVPQMEATLTLTRTSLRPKAGILTSRISAPGAASTFTTASMVLAMESLMSTESECQTAYSSTGNSVALDAALIAVKTDHAFGLYVPRVNTFGLPDLYSSDFPRGMLRVFHSDERRCFDRKTICPMCWA